MPLMKLAVLYQDEIDKLGGYDEYMGSDDEDDEIESDDEDEDVDAALAANLISVEEASDDEDDDEDGFEADLLNEIFRPEHFYYFKSFFTAKEAAALVGAAEGGKLAAAMEAALASYQAEAQKVWDDDTFGVGPYESEEDDDDLFEDEDDDDDDDDWDWDNDTLPFKDE